MVEFKRGDVVRVTRGIAQGEVFTITEIVAYPSKWGTHYARGDECDRGVRLDRLELATKDADLIRIHTSLGLQAFARENGLREDWHEPDERGISARVVGDHLDNAMGPTVEQNCGELNVILTHEGRDKAVVNLATLLSWAARA